MSLISLAIENLAKTIDATNALHRLLIEYQQIERWSPCYSRYDDNETKELRAIERRCLERRIRMAAHTAGFELPPLDNEVL